MARSAPSSVPPTARRISSDRSTGRTRAREPPFHQPFTFPSREGRTMTVAETREFLRARGCPEPVVSAGADGLVEEWENLVDRVEKGYPLGLDDYLNDLDGRELIAALMSAVARALTPVQKRRLVAADERMRAAVQPLEHCLWGDRLAAARSTTSSAPHPTRSRPK